MDEAIEAWAKSLNAKTEVSLARLKCKSEKEAMEGVNDDAYVKALDKFTNLDWRKMFLKMSDPWRRVWLNSLLK
ncbi:unnamed protein product [Prunus armeniaca]|uniref:Uncharacterized protein n=1 Tax=Prunus armeniaca TaxID=36596 RepID=A0A6J5VMD5_PRUAR|nr:unnamed protein product [Prunus armeniaca]CAB4319613.1 unnamed protein product [Prunus armeniaca]